MKRNGYVVTDGTGLGYGVWSFCLGDAGGVIDSVDGCIDGGIDGCVDGAGMGDYVCERAGVRVSRGGRCSLSDYWVGCSDVDWIVIGESERRRGDALLVGLLLGVGRGMARRLVDSCGGLLGLLGVEDVRVLVEGVGEDVEYRRRALRLLLRRLVGLVVEHRPQMRCPRDVWSLVAPVLSISPVEQLWAIALDKKQRVLAVRCLGQGTLDTAVLSPREVYRWLLSVNAALWVLVHNHPSGDPTPSPEDIAITRQMKHAGDLLKVELLDHLVVGKNDFRSLRQLGHF